MRHLILHTKTQNLINDFIKTPTHAVCLVGPNGSGKKFLALEMAKELLGSADISKIYIVGNSDKIGIEDVRNLKTHLKLKVPGQSQIKRVGIINDANRLSKEAQNALLKSLEEPPLDTVLILTVDNIQALAPTISSRAHRINVLPVDFNQVEAQIKAPSDILRSAFSLSDGHMGLLHALLDDSKHELSSAIAQAKTILQASIFERLTMVDGLAKDKPYLDHLLYGIQRITSVLIYKTTAKDTLARLNKNARAVYESRQQLEQNINTKLLLTDLFMRI